MRTLYIDCSAGISGDMLLAALTEIAHKTGAKADTPHTICEKVEHHNYHEKKKTHEELHAGNIVHKHHHEQGRSYSEVEGIINNAEGFSKGAKETAGSIYEAIAKAEAQVHGKTLETVHFHEVGRDKAIENALGTGAALEALRERSNQRNLREGADSLNIYVSPIYDGTGYIDCAHGRIPVPVPAVQAMKGQCPDFEFRVADEVETEMVTPSGLAALIGIGARPLREAGIDCAGVRDRIEAESDTVSPLGKLIAAAEVKGTRDTGRGGLKVTLWER